MGTRLPLHIIRKALDWPAVKSEDVKGMQIYSLFLCGCFNVMVELEYMQEVTCCLPTWEWSWQVMKKLPFKLRERWKTKAHEILGEKQQSLIQRSLLLNLIYCQADILSNPLFGDIQYSSLGAASPKRFRSQLTRNRVKWNIFAITVTLVDSVKEVQSPEIQANMIQLRRWPLICLGQRLPQFVQTTHLERLSFKLMSLKQLEEHDFWGRNSYYDPEHHSCLPERMLHSDKMQQQQPCSYKPSSTFWTDSTSVHEAPQYKNEDKCFHTFLANRITTTRDTTNISQWRYINTKDNPAEDASQGMKVDNLGSRWIEGPKFLWKP